VLTRNNCPAFTTDINVFADTNARAAAGNFLKVPVLTGTTANEIDIFLLAQELLTTGVSTPTISEMLSDVTTLVRLLLNFTTSPNILTQMIRSSLRALLVSLH